MPEGFSVGHANDEYTGVTCVLCKEGAVAGCDVRGGGPGTHETDLLKNEKAMEKINAVLLCGGSAYGLGAVAGVMEELRLQNVGFPVGDKVVPIVCGAVIFDLNDKDYHYPDKTFGQTAVKNATDMPVFGDVGVGKGATVGKIRGMDYACKSGIGIGTVTVGKSTVTCLVCVNALGDIIDEKTGAVLLGARKENGFLNTTDYILSGNDASGVFGKNTTIGCLMTDATVTKVQANKLASIAHNGLARTISPVHTDLDGDTIFCMASCKNGEEDFLQMEVAAQKAVALAVRDCATRSIGK